MQRKLYKKEERGLKGGPNYQVSEMTGSVTTTGYWPDSPDRNNDFNIIPSNEITMEGMDMPLIGIDNLGNMQHMVPGQDYTFPGNYVAEIPYLRNDPGFDAKPIHKGSPVAWPTDKTNNKVKTRRYANPMHFNQGGMYLGHYAFKDGGLVRMQKGGFDPSQPYMYLNPKTNTWLRPPENRDQNKMINWSVNTPAFAHSVDNPYNKGISGGKKVSPEEAAINKEKARQAYLQTPEGQEEERQRLMQEFVDQQNANKSPLQAAMGNLSLDNPATRDAARNYANYKLGISSPLNAFDRLATGRDTPVTTDFYRPNEATVSFGIPAAAVMAPIAVEGAVAAAPYVAEGWQALKTAAKPTTDAWNTILNAPRFGNSALTLGNGFKTLAAYDLSHKYIPNTIEDAQMYNETGDVKYLKDGAYNLGKGLLEIGASTGPLTSEVSAAKKPVSLIDDARKAVDVDKNIENRALSGIKTFKNVMGYMKEQGGGVFLGAYKQVGGQLVPHDISVPNLSRQEGGDMPFGLPLKEQNIYTLPEYIQPINPKTGEILPDPRRPDLGMGTKASEFKYTYGTDEGDIDIPSIVAGQYIGDQALDRYRLTGERFKTMTDPGSYSNFYMQMRDLGLMQEKKGGAVKKVKIKSLPKNWKSQ